MSIRHGGQSVVVDPPIADNEVGWWTTNVDFKANHFNTGGDIDGAFDGAGRVIDIDQALAETIDHHNQWRRSGAEVPLVSFGANTRGCRYHFPPVYRTNNRGNIESVFARIVSDANSASNFGFWYNPNLNRYVTLGTQPGP